MASLIALDRYIPWTEESGDITACGIPINYNASKEWTNKKVVLFSVPGKSSHLSSFLATPSEANLRTIPLGAFTPTCSANHMPGYIKNLPQLREKGVDIVAVVAFNDPFVMSAWGKANKVRDDEIVSRNKPSPRQSDCSLTMLNSSSSPTPMPSSPKALAGRTMCRVAQAGMPWSSTTAKLAMPRLRPRRELSR